MAHEPETHELVLWGQGEIHLQIAADRLRLKYNLPVKTRRPQVKYKETIREQHRPSMPASSARAAAMGSSAMCI